jgi:hypothetical protein
MTSGRKVRLMTFEGLSTAPWGCAPEENYWKLIGSEGRLILDPFKCCKDDRYSDERKLLVVFDISFKSLGLCAHQKNENSLWVSVTDLSEVS